MSQAISEQNSFAHLRIVQSADAVLRHAICTFSACVSICAKKFTFTQFLCPLPSLSSTMLLCFCSNSTLLSLSDSSLSCSVFPMSSSSSLLTFLLFFLRGFVRVCYRYISVLLPASVFLLFYPSAPKHAVLYTTLVMYFVQLSFLILSKLCPLKQWRCTTQAS